MVSSASVSPATKRELRNLGLRLKEARIRRKLTMESVAERAGLVRDTLYKIERGDPNVRIGSYAMVMQALGLLKGLGDLEDPFGDQLSLEQLPKQVRARE